MRTVITALMTAAFLLAAPASNAASPGTPHVTVGADIKQLIFDWDDVTGAAYYRVLAKVGTGTFKPVIDNIPASTTQARLSIAAHLQNWANTRYVVAACNTSGCTNSAAVFPQNLMLDAIGYFKASNTDPGDSFGAGIALSDDGRTLAVSARAEASNATGVNGNQADNSSANSGAVYVFRRTSNGWRQEAYLKAGVNQPGQFFGTGFYIDRGAIAINGDGSMLAVGAPQQDLPGTIDAGVVYIYQKSSSGIWSLAATLNSPTQLPKDSFGISVDLSVDGRTLKVNSIAPFDEEGNPEFRTHIFVRPGSTWQHSVTLAPFIAGDLCQTVRLSGDGNTLVFSCNGFTTGMPHVETRKRSGNSWTHVSDLPRNSYASFLGLALNFDASTMALQELGIPRVVGIYQWTGAAWARETGFPSPPIPDASGSPAYGDTLALNRTGNLLAIGDAFAAQAGAGVSPVSMPGSEVRGAVYVWQRADRNPPAWTLRSVVKSPNPNANDLFGISLALCGTGHALAVGAVGEDSKAKGVDGDRTDNSAPDSGAAYLY